MIGRHDFNTRWWGAPVGITSSVDVLTGGPGERPELDQFAWVEARVAQTSLPMAWLGPSNGFQHVDIQLHYRASLRRLAPLSPEVTITTAVDEHIDAADFAAFSSERYARLPGVTPERLASRYATWATDLVAQAPSTCATVRHRGEVAGYVFGSVADRRASFTLAVGSARGRAPGLVIYLAAAHLLRDAGAISMSSALSATNVAAVNAHVALDCIFTEATSVWIRIGDHAATDTVS